MAEKKQGVEATVRTIRRVTRKKYSAEGKVRIVLEGLRGEVSIAALCRREGISSNLYYRCSTVNPTLLLVGFLPDGRFIAPLTRTRFFEFMCQPGTD